MRSSLKKLAVAAGLTATLLAGCTASGSTASPTSAGAGAQVIRIASLKGPTTMGLVELMADADQGTARHHYQVTMSGTPDEVVPKLTSGQFDVALLPANLAAVLFNRTQGKVQVAAINTLGVLDLVQNGTGVNDWSDIKGRTIYSSGKGTTPEYTLRYLLTANGINPDTDVTIEYRSESTELAGLLAAKPDAVGVLPQPFVTTLQAKAPTVRTVLSLSDAWDRSTRDSRMITGVLVVRTDWAAANKILFNDFLADYQASTKFTNDNPAQAAPLIVKAGIAPDEQTAIQAIPSCHITYLAGTDLKSSLGGYLRVLYTANPDSVGGTLPGDGFYYQP